MTKIRPFIIVLVVTVCAWLLLAELALWARPTLDKATDEVVKAGEWAYFAKAKEWSTDLLGIAGTLAGFLGLGAAGLLKEVNSTERVQLAEGGVLGVLAGATLLEVGDWPVPIALVVLVTGAAMARVVQELRYTSISGGRNP